MSKPYSGESNCEECGERHTLKFRFDVIPVSLSLRAYE